MYRLSLWMFFQPEMGCKVNNWIGEFVDFCLGEHRAPRDGCVRGGGRRVRFCLSIWLKKHCWNLMNFIDWILLIVVFGQNFSQNPIQTQTAACGERTKCGIGKYKNEFVTRLRKLWEHKVIREQKRKFCFAKYEFLTKWIGNTFYLNRFCKRIKFEFYRNEGMSPKPRWLGEWELGIWKISTCF